VTTFWRQTVLTSKLSATTRRRTFAAAGVILGATGALALGLAPAANAAAAPAANAAVTLKNGSVILDSGKNFAEPNGSEGVAGPGCRNVGQPRLASSLVLDGGPIRIFTGRNCTGRSAVVSGDVADLSKIGFDKKIVSIRFGR
jgi:hypothetical protein